MATARREAPAEPKTPIDVGIDGSDMGIPVMSIAQTTSKAMKRGRAKFGDIIVGINSDDPETEVVAPQGSSIRVIVVAPVEKWRAMPFGKGDGRWDINDPEAPLASEVNYRYTMLVPSFSEDMPVHFYTRGSSARAMKSVINKLLMNAKQGTYPYELAFDMATEHIEANDNEWYVPLVTSAEPEASLIETGAEFYQQITASNARKQLESGSAGPSF